MKWILLPFLCVLMAAFSACATTSDQSAPVEHSAFAQETDAALPA